MEPKLLSIVIPVHNEEKWLNTLIQSVEAVQLEGVSKEFILVDDGSSDGTGDILDRYKAKYTVISHKTNRGKGAAVQTGFAQAHGDYIVIQDADLECDPSDLTRLLRVLQDNKADVVYGSRFVGSSPRRVTSLTHRLGNYILTLFSNVCTGLSLTDQATCYRMFKREALDLFKDKLCCNSFGIDPEITSYVAKMKLRVYEVGISYHARTKMDGKKITWKDGIMALWYIFKFNILHS